ncbi:MAG: hypothetical protein E7L45_06070 [Peptoniphilus lacydonensis]|uniref:hypothetical protein n=1 Tax=Peptoniphilus lacydonensis TaxID=1673725 RepID=UPI00258403AA|nr:hypothetical protein [Peptoniphilus lacydonensis]MDU7302860.1 hypothetical protein [Peptoniphilus lacydonensis]
MLIAFSLLTACGNRNLYSMKTDVSDLKGVEKIVNNLNWEKEKIKKVSVEDKNIKIYAKGESKDFYEMDLKPQVVNGIYLLILTDANEINYFDKNGEYFSIDRAIVDEILTKVYSKSIADYKNDEKEFKKLEKKLKDFKVESGDVKFKLKE